MGQEEESKRGTSNAMSDLKYRIMTSWLWPVLAFGVMGIWLVITTAILLGQYNPGFPYEFLAALNGVAHYATLLSLTAVAIEVMKPRKAIVFVIWLIFAWEMFEWISFPLWSSSLDYMDHLADTLADIAMSLFGIFTAYGLQFEQLRLVTSK